MRKTNKKGFTIVELVIVIAVVAILAAVLVPTFVSVVKKANESKDTQLVRNLNTALAVDTEVGKHETMQSALEAAAKAGYDVAKINASATDNEILWDSKNDCFVYKKDSGIEYIPNSVSEEQQKAVKNYQYWIIASAPDATYSTYLYDYKGSGTETVTTGLDVGNETVAAITYKNDTANAQEVVIRTNSFDTELTVNATTDSIYHYGIVGSVIGEVVHKDSYYEFGQYKFREEKVGHFVDMVNQENGAIRYISNKEAQYDVEEGIVPVPAYVAADISTSDIKGSGNVSEKLTVDTDNTKENIKNGAVLFAGGNGTKETPFIINSLENWYNFTNSTLTYKGKYWKVSCDLDFNEASTYVNVKNFSGEIDFDNHKVIAVPERFSNYEMSFFDYVNQGSVIKNLEFVISGQQQVVFLACSIQNAAKIDKNGNDVVLINIVTLGNAQTSDNNYTPYIWGVADNNTKLVMKNCSNYANISSTASASAAVFLGKVYEGEDYTGIELEFENCNNYGQLVHTTGYAGMLIGNGCSFKNISLDKISVSNCKNYGTILSKTNSGLICGYKNEGLDIDNKTDALKKNGQLINAENGRCEKAVIGNISVSDGKFVLAKTTNATKYIITFSFWVKTFNNVQSEAVNWGSAGKGVELSSEEYENLQLPAYQWTTDTSNATKLNVGNGYFYTNGSQYVFKDIADYGEAVRYEISNITLSIIAYDNNNNTLSIYTYLYD